MDMDADKLEELASFASNEKNKTTESQKFTSLIQKPAAVPAKNVSVAEMEAEDIEEEQTV